MKAEASSVKLIPFCEIVAVCSNIFKRPSVNVRNEKKKSRWKSWNEIVNVFRARACSTRVIRITQVILKYQEVLPEWYAQSYLLSGFPNTESVMVCNLIAGIARFQTFSRTIDYFCNRRNNAINRDSARIISLLSSTILFADVFLLNRCCFEIVNHSLREIFWPVSHSTKLHGRELYFLIL